MDIAQQLGRISNARVAMIRAQNPKFQDLWFKVDNKLVDGLGPGQPWLRTYDGKLK
jgi:hypothetical protein